MADPKPNQAFLDSLPEAYRTNPTFQDIPDVATLAKRFDDTYRTVGMDKIALPKDPKDPEWNNTYAKLGRPAKPEEYQFQDGKALKFPEGFAFQEEGIKAFQAKAHELGLSQAQAAGLYEFYAGTAMGAYNKEVERITNEAAEAEKALRTKFGSDYDAKMARANRIFAAFAGKENAEALAAKFGRDPLAMTLITSIADKLSDDVIGDGQPKTGMTADDIQAEIAKLEDLKGPWGDKNHPEHALTIKKLNGLYEALNDLKKAGKK